MTKKATAPAAKAGAAAPATAKATQPNPLHQPTPRRPRDAHTGKGGTYTRDPVTGQRTPVQPVASATGGDTAAA